MVYNIAPLNCEIYFDHERKTPIVPPSVIEKKRYRPKKNASHKINTSMGLNKWIYIKCNLQQKYNI